MYFNRENWRQLAALVPVYDEQGGNCTEIWLTDGQIIIDKRRVDTVVKELAGVFAISLPLLRRNCSKSLGLKRNLPLPLHRDLWLVPVICRNVQGSKDGAMGYLVSQQIQMLEAGRPTVVVLGESRLSLPESTEGVRKAMTLTQMAGSLLA